MLIFGSNKHQFSQTYTILLAKKVNRKSPFYFDFLIPYDKNVHSLKNSLLSCSYVVKKTSILWKTLLSCHFFWIFVKNPYCYAHIWSEKCQFCQNYIRLWSQKVNRMAFLPIFDKKSLLSFPYFVKINVYFLENKRLSCPYLVKKRQFFQKHGAHIFFYNIL